MSHLSRLLVLWIGWWLAVFPVFGEEPPSAAVELDGREIAVLRATVNGATPTARARFVAERLQHMDLHDLSEPVTRARIVLDGLPGALFSIGDRMLFTLYDADLDPRAHLTHAAAAEAVETRLRQALDERVNNERPGVYLRGLLLALLATALAYALFKLLQLAARFLMIRLKDRLERSRSQPSRSLQLAGQGWMLLGRIVRLLLIFCALTIAYLWLTYVLEAFPLTRPFGDRLSAFLIELLIGFGRGIVAALPGMITVAVVLFLTKAVSDAVAIVFERIGDGRASIPGIHPETASATRRLVAILIWGFGLAIAYPYLPVADSDAFKGLSVMFGFMLTLGSAGIVTQVMSGLVLVYSRALRAGDFVAIGEVVGVVKEMGVLSTKIINQRNEEITIPNAVLVGNPIKNYTSAGVERGALVSTSVTIGYDTPWRQVHAMLIAAAEQTGGLRSQPKPFVMQKSLQDFYVEYELFAYVDRPLERLQILSELHSRIQDEFNTWGVQIMSPHFVLQPKKDVVVDRERWFAEPAESPPRTDSR